MAESENQTLRLLREFRDEFREFRQEFADFRDRTGERFDRLAKRFTGESILGRYAVAQVDDRLGAIEKRLDALEKAD